MDLSMFMGILGVLYAVIAGFCLAMTLIEGAFGRHRGWDLMRVAGLGLALFWPLIIAILFFSSPRGQRLRAAARDFAAHPFRTFEKSEPPHRSAGKLTTGSAAP